MSRETALNIIIIFVGAICGALVGTFAALLF